MRRFAPVRTNRAEGLFVFGSFFFISVFPLRHPEWKLLESKDLREAILFVTTGTQFQSRRISPCAMFSAHASGSRDSSLRSRMTQGKKKEHRFAEILRLRSG